MEDWCNRCTFTPHVCQGFAEDIPTFEELRQFKFLHQAILETLRLYPVAPLLPRYVAQPFEFAGCRVDRGKVFNAISLPHFLPEYYPDPWSFRLDRERAKAETFVPFGVGKHTCVASGIARVLLVVTIATLLRRGRFSLGPNRQTTDFRKINLSNIENYSFRLKLLEKYDSQ
ncbi:MAG: cytochrome P450 [Cyanobacteria bacterium P01_F01_bin.150]